ncbi:MULTISPECIES: SAM-dependent methyltransferase [unclassified Polynucleobacter]|uniref:SAM-dependent methyltransferase n=1 Tax=unclassified Polynucleobacter TaxID=2640945 RepID=UPI0025743438|nr:MULTISPECIES: SAM-dependent methyltransferase [unclassified Polynucleobacter]BEI42315.1 SAM-dependent methyltransferase [Polynucleobacter sp. HIN10]BEI44068.1 SAM-dependent methyltransferase [Polynucleobacter sp. HIN11]
MQIGNLYLVPNTLGSENRAAQLHHVMPAENLRQIAKIKYWIVEDAKTSRAFLNAVHEIEPLHHSLQEMSMQEWRGPDRKHTLSLKPEELLAPIQAGHDVGLLSEAGVPGVADPGAEIVQVAHQWGAKVKPLVGPSSILLGLMASGLNGQLFQFNGYLPVEAAERSKKLKELEESSRRRRETQIWIETPYRNSAMLQSCLSSLSLQTRLCVAIDLTLSSEWVWTGSIESWRKRYTKPEGLSDLIKNRPTIFLLLA